MLRIGFRAHDFGSFSNAAELGQALHNVRKESFIQLAIYKAFSSPKTWDEWDEEYISSITDTLKSYGVSIAIVGCYINPIESDEEKRKLEVKRFEKSLSLTKAFGCPYVATETGIGGFTLDKSSVKNFELCKKTISEIIDAAEKYNAYATIEPVSRVHAVSTPERVRNVVETFDSDHFRMILDPVNLIPWTGIPEKDGVSLRVPSEEAENEWVSNVLDIIAPKLAAIHCKDYFLKEDGTKKGDIAALTGDFRWKNFAQECHKRSIDVPWLLENLNPQTVSGTASILSEY